MQIRFKLGWNAGGVPAPRTGESPGCNYPSLDRARVPPFSALTSARSRCSVHLRACSYCRRRPRSPLGRRSPPRLPGAPSPGGSVAALLLRRDRDDPRFTQRPHNGGGASHASLDRSLDRVPPPSEEVRGADPSDRPSGGAIGPARTDHARWLPGVFPTRRR